MYFDLTDEQEQFIAAARDYAAGELAPHAAEWDANHTFPQAAIATAGALGFCGRYASEDYGGLGLSRLNATLVFEELAAVDPSTTAFITIHNMATWMIPNWAKPEIAEQYAPALTAGEQLASYALTEPGAGSDAASLRTTAVRDGDDYVINGEKMFISGAGSTNVLVLMCRTGGPGADGISAFVVPADTPGITYGKNEEKLGWRSQPTRAISFQDVRVPASHMLGEEGEGFKIAMKGLDGGRINIATCSVGAAQGALNAATQYMQERQQFGKPLAAFQALQFKLADMQTHLVAARQMVRLAAYKLDSRSSDASTYCAMAKRFATDVCFDVVNDALQLHGGYGYLREFPIERLLRDVRVHQILEGTNEIMRVIISRRLLNSNQGLDSLR